MSRTRSALNASTPYGPRTSSPAWKRVNASMNGSAKGHPQSGSGWTSNSATVSPCAEMLCSNSAEYRTVVPSANATTMLLESRSTRRMSIIQAIVLNITAQVSLEAYRVAPCELNLRHSTGSGGRGSSHGNSALRAFPRWGHKDLLPHQS